MHKSDKADTLVIQGRSINSSNLQKSPEVCTFRLSCGVLCAISAESFLELLDILFRKKVFCRIFYVESLYFKML